jgi:hypothetical protein
MNQIILKFLNLLLFILIIFPVLYIIPGIFAQDLSTIQDDIEIVDNKVLISLLQVVIPSGSVVFTGFIAVDQYKESRKLREQELNLQRQKMLFDLTNEIDSSENSEKMFLAKAILDNLSCNIPSYDEKWGSSNKEVFDYYSTHYDQLNLNHILRDHYPQPITDPKEKAIRQSFDALLDYFCRIEYMYKTRIITEQELNYFRYYILKIKDNKAVMEYLKRYKFPLSDDFINKLEELSKTNNNYL